MATLATELWTGANGAAWPAQWTTAVSGTAVIDIQSNGGRLKSQNVTAFLPGHLASLTGVTARGDWDVTLDVSFATVVEQYFIVTLRATGQSGTTGPTNCYAVRVNPATNGWELIKWVAGSQSTVATTLTAPTLVANTPRRMRFQVTGTTVRFRQWDPASAEPTTWDKSGTDSTVTGTGTCTLSNATGTTGTVAVTATVDNLTVTDGTNAPTPVATYGPGVPSAGGSVTTPQTASVTVAAGDVLLLWAGTGNGNVRPQMPTGGTADLVWTQLADPNSAHSTSVADLVAWWAPIITGQTFTCSVAVADSAGSGHAWTWQAVRYSGASGIGAVASTTAGGSAPSLAITTTKANASVLLAVVDWAAVSGTSRTWRVTAGAFTETYYNQSTPTASFYAGYHTSVATAGAQTVGLTAPTGQTPTMIAAEVLPGSIVNLSGSGALTTTVTPSATVATALTGSGTLTTTVAPRIIVATALSGLGAVTTAVTPSTTVPTALTGSGAVTTALTPSITVATALTGSGTLTTTTAFALVVNTTLGSTGTLTVALVPALTVTLGGDGLLTTTVHAQYGYLYLGPTQTFFFRVGEGRSNGLVGSYPMGLNTRRDSLGQWHTEPYTTADDRADADRLYAGGHSNPINASQRAELIAAGFGAYIQEAT